jgi:plasmid maintenance system antidote protein VapI
MTGDQLRRYLVRNKLTHADFAKIVQRDERTVRRWIAGDSPIPFWVKSVLK